MQSSITQIIGLSVAGAAIVAVTVLCTANWAYGKGVAQGWSDGYFDREKREKKRHDAQGRFRTMETD